MIHMTLKSMYKQVKDENISKNNIQIHDNNNDSSLSTSFIQNQLDMDVENDTNYTNNVEDNEIQAESTNVSISTMIKKRGRPKLNENEMKNSEKKQKNNAQKRKMKISEMAKELKVDDPYIIEKIPKQKVKHQKSKPPYISIQGSSINEPVSVTVINSYLEEEDDQNRKMLQKKFHDLNFNLNFPNLKKEDVSSWICVFCKHGSNYTTFKNNQIYYSGDLYGPYYITIKDELNNEDDLINNLPNTSSSTVQQNVSNALLGLTKVNDSEYEVWFHEDCILWTPNVYMIDTKIYGIEDTVRDAIKTKCTQCGLTGASLCCFRRGCNKFTHYQCAIFYNWEMNYLQFIQYCPMHTNNLLEI